MPPPYDTWTPRSSRIEGLAPVGFISDASENPRTTTARPCRLKGYIYRGRNIGKDEYVPGRMGMVCCAEDVRFVGFIAKANGLPIPQPKTCR